MNRKELKMKTDEKLLIIIENLIKKCLDEGIRLGLKYERTDGLSTVNIIKWRDDTIESIFTECINIKRDEEIK